MVIPSPADPPSLPPPNSRYKPHFSLQNQRPPTCNPKSKSLELFSLLPVAKAKPPFAPPYKSQAAGKPIKLSK